MEAGSRASRELEQAINGTNGSSIGTDYRGRETLKAFRKVNQAGWGLVVKIDTEEINAKGADLIKIYLFGGLAIILIAWGAALLMARTLVKPLDDMGNTLELVSQGVLPENIATGTRDEFGKMSDKVDSLVQTLKKSAEFAKNVGEGKLDAHFQPVSENDTLGQALIHMRDDLIENERKDNERNWIVRGVAEAAEILRAHDTLDELGNDVIKFIADKIGAVQGAFYDVNSDNRNSISIEIRASFAYGRKKYLKKTFRFAEGLVGQAVAEKDIV